MWCADRARERDQTWRLRASQAAFLGLSSAYRAALVCARCPAETDQGRAGSLYGHAVDKDLMKAAVITRYGPPDIVKILDVPKPTPAADELLVRVHAATVNRTDCGELRAHPFFIRL